MDVAFIQLVHNIRAAWGYSDTSTLDLAYQSVDVSNTDDAQMLIDYPTRLIAGIIYDVCTGPEKMDCKM